MGDIFFMLIGYLKQFGKCLCVFIGIDVEMGIVKCNCKNIFIGIYCNILWCFLYIIVWQQVDGGLFVCIWVEEVKKCIIIVKSDYQLFFVVQRQFVYIGVCYLVRVGRCIVEGNKVIVIKLVQFVGCVYLYQFVG